MGSARRSHIALDRVVQRDPEVHSGDLVFAGTRVPADRDTPSRSFSRTIPPSNVGNWSHTLICLPKGRFLPPRPRPDRDALREEPRSEEERA